MYLCMKKNLPLRYGRWNSTQNSAACWAKHRLVFFNLQTLKCVILWMGTPFTKDTNTGGGKFYVIKFVEVSSKIPNWIHLCGHQRKRKIGKECYQKARGSGSFWNERGDYRHLLVLAIQRSLVITLSKTLSSDQREILFTLIWRMKRVFS